MGLAFSHCDAQWSYSGFNHFRTKLAAEIGVALHCMEFFAVDRSNYTLCENVKVRGYDNGKEGGEVGIQPVIKWNTVKDDIVPLLTHSDSDGKLTPEECRKIAPRLRELVEDWADEDRDKTNAILLAEGMELAVKNEEILNFL